MPNLENLTLTCHRGFSRHNFVDLNNIRMESVKTLILPDNIPQGIVLPNLQEFHRRLAISGQDARRQTWLEFFHIHTSIKRLYIDWRGSETLKDFNQFTAHLSEMTEFYINNWHEFDANDIIQFVQNNHLTILRLSQFNEGDQVALHEAFDSD